MIVLVDGFDYLPYNPLSGGSGPSAAPWTHKSSTIYVTDPSFTPPGRHGGKYGAIGSGDWLGKVFSASERDTTAIIGVALAAGSGDICTFSRGGITGSPVGSIPIATIRSTGSALQVYSGWGPSGGQSVACSGGSPGTLVATSAALSMGSSTYYAPVWVYIEAMLSDAGIIVRHEDLEVINISSPASGGTDIDNLFFWGNVLFDDLYILSGNAPLPNSFIGTGAAVNSGFPSGAGSSTEWTPSSGSNYDRVNDASPSGNVSSDVMDEVDLYQLDVSSGVSAPNEVLGVQLSAKASKSDTGTRSLALLSRADGITEQGPDIAIGAGTNDAVTIFHTKPNGDPWTGATGTEFGIKVR